MSVARVEVERNLPDDDSGRVVRVSLNRPEARNALGEEMVAELADTLDALDADEAVGALVLAGRGSVFCAGGDLKSVMNPARSMADAHAARSAYADLLRRLTKSRLPVVAAVEGDALGGGLGLVAACDVVYASAEACFGTPEVRLGLFPWVVAAVLSRDVPRKQLAEIALTGGRWTAEEACRHGLVNRTLAPGDVMAHAVRTAGRMAKHSAWVLGRAKSALAKVADLPTEAALDHMNDHLTLNLMTEDAHEGIQAFLERRDPVWSGR